MKKFVGLLFLLVGCAGTNWTPPAEFTYVPVGAGEYEIATWQKIQNPTDSHIHIYIEGDGNAFDAYGRPNDDPTPRGTLVRDLVARDGFDNVVYVARPCQFIMNENCDESDWTNGRFSKKIIDTESDVIQKIAGTKQIILIGYSGGAMVSGLVIANNPELNFEKWITIAGVLNHEQWTNYFGDEDLVGSMNMDALPRVSQKHFVGGRDTIVPYELAKNWADANDIIIIESASHDDFGNLKIFD